MENITTTINHIKITITIGKRQAIEELSQEDINAIKEHFQECKENGANPDLENVSLARYVRYIKINGDELESVNGGKNAHFIFGYIECLVQSDCSPMMWLYETNENEPMQIEVTCNITFSHG